MAEDGPVHTHDAENIDVEDLLEPVMNTVRFSLVDSSL
jgi:hypothetical protein